LKELELLPTDKRVQVTQVVQDRSTTIKYIIICFIMITILALAIVLLCCLRRCMADQNRKQIEKIQAQIINNTDTSVQNTSNVVAVEGQQ